MATKIKILCISEDFSYIGGVEKYLWYLASHLNTKIFDLRFVCIGGKNGPIGQKIEKLGFPVHALSHNVLYDHMTSFFDVIAIYRLILLIRKYHPDIVQTWDIDGNYFGRIASLFAGLPPIVATDVTRWDMREGFVNRLHSFLLRCSNNFLDMFTHTIIVNSKDIKTFRTNRVNADKIRLLYHPFDSERFLKSGSGYQRTHQRMSPILGVVARLAYQKGHTYLLRAIPEVLRRFPTARLVVVGTGPLKKTLKEQAKNLGIARHVLFTGEVVENVPEIMASFDILIQPSLYEGGGPTTVLEAMAIGIPVIGTNVGGMRTSIINGKTGILVAPKDPDALAQTICTLLSNKKLAKEMGKEAKRALTDKTYYLPTYIRSIEHLYREIKCSYIRS